MSDRLKLFCNTRESMPNMEAVSAHLFRQRAEEDFGCIPHAEGLNESIGFEAVQEEVPRDRASKAARSTKKNRRA